MTATIVVTFLFSRWTDVPFQNIYFLILIIYVVIHWLLIDFLCDCLHISHCIFGLDMIASMNINSNVWCIVFDNEKSSWQMAHFFFNRKRLGNDTNYWKWVENYEILRTVHELKPSNYGFRQKSWIWKLDWANFMVPW